MKSKMIVLICLLALMTTVAMADTVTSSYDAGTSTWTYDVSFTNATRWFFRVYLDPNMNINYLKDITNDSTGINLWLDPTSLGTENWTDPVTTDTITLTYLEWDRNFSPDNTVEFYYTDARDTTVNAPHMMELVNHAGPLLHSPPSYANAPSTEMWTSTGETPSWGQTGDHVAITPEPATITLLSLGLLGLAAVVRRRRGM